jgi:hypothetical protein
MSGDAGESGIEQGVADLSLGSEYIKHFLFYPIISPVTSIPQSATQFQLTYKGRNCVTSLALRLSIFLINQVFSYITRYALPGKPVFDLLFTICC